MATPDSVFPAQAWNGLSANPDRKDRAHAQPPDPRDWDQIVSETVAIESLLISSFTSSILTATTSSFNLNPGSSSTFQAMSDLTLTFTTVGVYSMVLMLDVEAAPLLSHGQILQFQISLDGTIINTIEFVNTTTTPSGSPNQRFSAHTVLSSIAAGAHTLTVASSNGGNSQQWTLTNGRITGF